MASAAGTVTKKIIKTAAAAAAAGPYSQAVLANGTLYISGQLGFNPSTMELVAGGVKAQTKQALTNMGEILKAAGGGFENVVKVTVLLSDIKEWPAMNEVYATCQLDLIGNKQVFKMDSNPWVAPIQDQLQVGVSHVIDYIRSDTYKFVYGRHMAGGAPPPPKTNDKTKKISRLHNTTPGC